MSKNVLTTTFVAIACSAIVAAQAPPSQVPAPASQPPAPAQRAPEAKAAPADDVTVTGCVERRVEASSATPGAIGTAGAVGIENRGFILTKVMNVAGPAASNDGPAPAVIYRLDADEKELSGHVGQKVEITGTADRSASPSRPGDTPPLKVKSLKMLASTCTS